MTTPIHHTFAPLANSKQCKLARSLLIHPSQWRTGRDTETLRHELSRAYQADVFLFASGREALLALLRSLKLKEGDEIIVQGYTCVVVPNAIEAAGCVPVFVDIDPDTLNLSPQEVARAINPKTRAIICQHTFGIPADTRALRELCDRTSVLLIEDCAHILPDERGPSDIAVRGDFVFFSFGRDKAISGVAGGAILSRDAAITSLLQKEEDRAVDLAHWTIVRLLLYPLIYAIGRTLYTAGGKALLALYGRLKLLVPIVNGEEKGGKMSPHLHRLPNACAALALAQWHHLRAFNDRRRMLTALYLQESRTRGWSDGLCQIPQAIRPYLPLQKFPLFVHGADGIRRFLKAQQIHLDDGWTGCVICPWSVDPADAGYERGMDPTAEAVCQKILSLPTHPTMTEAQARHLIETLDALLRKRK